MLMSNVLFMHGHALCLTKSMLSINRPATLVQYTYVLHAYMLSKRPPVALVPYIYDFGIICALRTGLCNMTTAVALAQNIP